MNAEQDNMIEFVKATAKGLSKQIDATDKKVDAMIKDNSKDHGHVMRELSALKGAIENLATIVSERANHTDEKFDHLKEEDEKNAAHIERVEDDANKKFESIYGYIFALATGTLVLTLAAAVIRSI